MHKLFESLGHTLFTFFYAVVQIIRAHMVGKMKIIRTRSIRVIILWYLTFIVLLFSHVHILHCHAVSLCQNPTSLSSSVVPDVVVVRDVNMFLSV